MGYAGEVTASASTIEGLERQPEGRAAAWGRRAMLLAMVAGLVAGAGGLLGVHTSTQSASRGGYRLSLHYPATARAGLDTAWQVTVEHPGGFGKMLTLAVTGAYFRMFETQGFEPEPSKSTRDEDTLYLTFDPPPGSDTFVVDFDAYIQPASQQGGTSRLAVLEQDEPVVWLDYRTRLLP
jgi:hypothetical protein